MDGKECAQIVQQRRHNRGFGDLNVVYADELCHDKRGCAHDRRHDLTARGRDSFDGGRPFVGISGFFHGGNGKNTGGNDVADGASGDHAKQGRGDDGYLARAAGKPTGEALTHLDEGFCSAGSGKDRTENAEHGEHCGGKPQHRSPNAARAVIKVLENHVEGEVLMSPNAGEHFAVEGVDEESNAQNWERPTNRATAGF